MQQDVRHSGMSRFRLFVEGFWFYVDLGCITSCEFAINFGFVNLQLQQINLDSSCGVHTDIDVFGGGAQVRLGPLERRATLVLKVCLVQLVFGVPPVQRVSLVAVAMERAVSEVYISPQYRQRSDSILILNVLILSALFLKKKDGTIGWGPAKRRQSKRWRRRVKGKMRAEGCIPLPADCNTPFTRWSKRQAKTWSKHEANLEHTSCMCILNTFAWCLLFVYFIVKTRYKIWMSVVSYLSGVRKNEFCTFWAWETHAVILHHLTKITAQTAQHTAIVTTRKWR